MGFVKECVTYEGSGKGVLVPRHENVSIA